MNVRVIKQEDKAMAHSVKLTVSPYQRLAALGALDRTDIDIIEP